MNLYNFKDIRIEGALSSSDRVQLATHRAELVAIAVGTLGDPVFTMHLVVASPSGIGTFFVAVRITCLSFICESNHVGKARSPL